MLDKEQYVQYNNIIGTICSNNIIFQRRDFMKKVLATIMVCLLVACSSFMMACSSVSGTYKFDSLSYSEAGVMVEVTAGEEFMGVTITEDFMTIQLNEDGTATVSAQGQSSQATWVQEGSTVKITSNGNVQQFALDGNKLSVTDDGITIILKK